MQQQSEHRPIFGSFFKLSNFVSKSKKRPSLSQGLDAISQDPAVVDDESFASFEDEAKEFLQMAAEKLKSIRNDDLANSVNQEAEGRSRATTVSKVAQDVKSSFTSMLNRIRSKSNDDDKIDEKQMEELNDSCEMLLSRQGMMEAYMNKKTEDILSKLNGYIEMALQADARLEACCEYNRNIVETSKVNTRNILQYVNECETYLNDIDSSITFWEECDEIKEKSFGRDYLFRSSSNDAECEGENGRSQSADSGSSGREDKVEVLMHQMVDKFFYEERAKKLMRARRRAIRMLHASEKECQESQEFLQELEKARNALRDTIDVACGDAGQFNESLKITPFDHAKCSDCEPSVLLSDSACDALKSAHIKATNITNQLQSALVLGNNLKMVLDQISNG